MDTVKQFLATVAPLLGTALGGPLGGYAGTLVAKALGAKSSSSTDLQAAMAGATPDQIIALQNANNTFKEDMAKLGFQEDQLAYQDIAGARSMQTTTRDPYVYGIAFIMILGFLMFCIGECTAMIVWPQKWGALPTAAVGMMGTIFGYLANEAKQVTAFLYGSSVGSQNKDQTLAEIAKSD
jgi:hypothetical protein